MEAKNKKDDILNFKVTDHLKKAILKKAERAGLRPSSFIREVIKKHIKYKEPDLV
jgi:predicted DNA binding CopG/RHH family protein